MALTTELARQVPADVQSKGRDYYARGAVRIHRGNAREVEAIVQGGELYDVTLKRKGKSVHAWCSCPYCEDRGEPCKHIWATLLAAEARGDLRTKVNGTPRFLELD